MLIVKVDRITSFSVTEEFLDTSTFPVVPVKNQLLSSLLLSYLLVFGIFTAAFCKSFFIQLQILMPQYFRCFMKEIQFTALLRGAWKSVPDL